MGKQSEMTQERKVNGSLCQPIRLLSKTWLVVPDVSASRSVGMLDCVSVAALLLPLEYIKTVIRGLSPIPLSRLTSSEIGYFLKLAENWRGYLTVVSDRTVAHSHSIQRTPAGGSLDHAIHLVLDSRSDQHSDISHSSSITHSGCFPACPPTLPYCVRRAVVVQNLW